MNLFEWQSAKPIQDLARLLGVPPVCALGIFVALAQSHFNDEPCCEYYGEPVDWAMEHFADMFGAAVPPSEIVHALIESGILMLSTKGRYMIDLSDEWVARVMEGVGCE